MLKTIIKFIRVGLAVCIALRYWYWYWYHLLNIKHFKKIDNNVPESRQTPTGDITVGPGLHSRLCFFDWLHCLVSGWSPLHLTRLYIYNKIVDYFHELFHATLWKLSSYFIRI